MSAMVLSSVSIGAMRDHGGVTGALGHFDGGKGLGQGTDLVDLDQDRVADALLDAFLRILVLVTKISSPTISPCRRGGR